VEARRQTILVVDDAEDDREAYAALLRSSGFNVVTAGSGQEAVSLAPRHHIDVLLTDLNLPDCSGEQVIQRLRAQASSPLRIAAITGEPGAREAPPGYAGADIIFTKPAEWNSVLQWIRGATG
jgi:CheY-like chemotaxis protein